MIKSSQSIGGDFVVNSPLCSIKTDGHDIIYSLSTADMGASMMQHG